MVSSKSDTTIRLKKDTKRILANLDFVGKEHSYDNIVLELVNRYKESNNKGTRN